MLRSRFAPGNREINYPNHSADKGMGQVVIYYMIRVLYQQGDDSKHRIWLIMEKGSISHEAKQYIGH